MFPYIRRFTNKNYGITIKLLTLLGKNSAILQLVHEDYTYTNMHHSLLYSVIHTVILLNVLQQLSEREHAPMFNTITK